MILVSLYGVGVNGLVSKIGFLVVETLLINDDYSDWSLNMSLISETLILLWSSRSSMRDSKSANLLEYLS